MATFRVGQRVKKVRGHSEQPNFRGFDPARIAYVPIGSEGTIIPRNVCDGECSVVFDNVKSPHPTGAYSIFAYQLEPIQPEGNQVIAWSECLWQPEHMRESA